MTRSRGAFVVGSLAVTVLALVFAVVGWGNDGLQAADAIAGVFSLTFAVVTFAAVRNEPKPQAGRQYWTAPRTRSGAGAALLLGGVAAGLMLVAVLGTVALLVR
ncbi:hypothetical protein [Paractinoplanes rishiriensis]|uniref:Uncharacterized protein n=1 Tax=Paractinoplanes rishiriensis TaxID=1050105 RepID=A0A919N1B0_9ACTN|nr:hypothetical protein [Actinoplanes rishiriensis]GIF00986.1 hypothetical protein Ari01nite_84500 [Actinoplanes rishiriensis]